MAQRRGYLSDQAIACEQASRFLLQVGRTSDSVKYQHEAMKLYASLGMIPKIDQLKAEVIVEEKDDTLIDFVLMK